MASNLFKTQYIPNNNGTDSAVAATNANTAFVHTYLGDDATGDGTREKPFRSTNKATQKSGTSYILFRGVVDEYVNIPAGKDLLGDDNNQNIITKNYSVSVNTIVNATIEFVPDLPICFFKKAICTGDIITVSRANPAMNYCFFGKKMQGRPGNRDHLTIVELSLYNYPNTDNIEKNLLISNKFNVVNLTFGSLYPQYVVFPSSIVVSYNSVNIVLPKFIEDSVSNIQYLRDALKCAGMNISHTLFLPKNSFYNETCKIINEQRSGGTRPNVFNKYAPNITGTLDAPIAANTAKTSITLMVADASKVPDTGDLFIPFVGTYANNGASITDGNEVFTYTSKVVNSPTSVTLNGASYTFKMPHSAGVVCTRYGDVLDYTLNPDVRNEALYASDTGGYVGCFAPAVKKDFSGFNAPVNVGADGADAGSSGDLMQFNDADGLTFNNASAQTWNRARTAQVIEIQRGQTFKGLNIMSQDGSPFGYYVGKHQNLIGADKIFAGGNLAVGKIYKIFNDTAKDTTTGIIYNGVNYFPEYTFVCVAVAPSFAEINPGSGTYVREVLADVLESIEVLPYDNETTPSAFPRFSAPLMGEPKLIFYTATGAARYGKAIGAPVLFSHLKEANFIADFGGINDKIAYYDSFAVSNADQEFYRLTNAELNATLKGYFKTDIPLLKYLHLEINGHFDEPYDY